jgi:hypothetical protein
VARRTQGFNMEIVFLGTSGSWPSAQRNVAATAVRRGGEYKLRCSTLSEGDHVRVKLKFQDGQNIALARQQVVDECRRRKLVLFGIELDVPTGQVHADDESADQEVYGPRDALAEYIERYDVPEDRADYAIAVLQRCGL